MLRRHLDKVAAMALSLLVIVPAAWMLLIDRTPPLMLYDGRVIPDVVQPGQTGVTVVWRARFSGRDCGGYTQRELVDARHNLWHKRKRARGGIFHPSPTDPRDGTVTTPPLFIPARMAPGPATYRVTQFYYCNFLQRWTRWPIVQPSPRIRFTVIAPSRDEGRR